MRVIDKVIRNLKINYIKEGKGKSVLIIPGWGASIDTYRTIINSVSEYATVYCLDVPGFGGSEEPKQAWNLEDYTQFIIDFIESEKIKELDLIGHSNGGRIIINLASKSNLKFKINKIILIGSAGIVHKKSFIKRAKIRTFKICKKVLSIQLINKNFPKLLDKLKSSFGSEDYKNASPILRETMVKLVNQDVKELLPKIKSPTLLIWGENDEATPIIDGELMEKIIPDAGLVKIKGASHYVFLEQPYYVNKIIYTFLNGG